MRSAPHNANLNLRVTQVFADEVNEGSSRGAYVSGGVTYRNPRRKEELQKAIEVLAELAAPPWHLGVAALLGKWPVRPLVKSRARCACHN